MAPLNILATAFFLVAANGAPTPVNKPDSTITVRAPAPEPQLLGGLVGGLVGVTTTLTATVVQALNGTLSELLYVQPTSIPHNINDVLGYLHNRFQDHANTGYGPNGKDYTLNGILSSITGAKGLKGATIADGSQGINSFKNSNPAPPKTIYPRANSQDPRFSVAEAALRSAIFIPPTFDAKSAKNPVLLITGTGGYAGITYDGNFAKILQADPSIGQPVWLNIPDAMLADTQTNAEHIAYAINYVNAITGKSVNIIAWSQGNVDTQWAFKYFPSTRASAKQLISISPDFHGTALANVIDIGTDLLGLVPQSQAFLQQEYNSEWITQLRKNDGDSAYVPTTTFYSAVFDEIVQPQEGTGASAYLKDARGVGVSNNEIQTVCGLTPAGTLGTHESLLYNGLVVSMALEALKKGKPTQPGDVDLATVCQNAVYPGLELLDVLQTEAVVPLAFVNMLEYVGAGKGVFVEPPLAPYATY